MSLLSNIPFTDGPVLTAADLNARFAAVQNSVNNIDASNITDKSITAVELADEINPALRGAELVSNFVASGLNTGFVNSSFNGNISSGVVYISGKRIIVPAIVKSFTANRDTYVDIKDDGTPSYVEVTNGNNTGMALTLNSDGSPAIRVAKFITNGMGVSSVDWLMSNTFSGFDPLGNPVYNTNSRSTQIGFVRISSGTQGATTSVVTFNGAGGFVRAYVPRTGMRIRVRLYLSSVVSNTASSVLYLTLWDGAVGTGTQLRQANIGSNSTGFNDDPSVVEFTFSPTLGYHTFGIGWRTSDNTTAWSWGDGEASVEVV